MLTTYSTEKRICDVILEISEIQIIARQNGRVVSYAPCCELDSESVLPSNVEKHHRNWPLNALIGKSYALTFHYLDSYSFDKH